jgi:hypothetical protein
MRFTQPKHSDEISTSAPPARGERIRFHRPPAVKLRRWAQFIYSRQTFDRVFDDLFTDILDEYFEALSRNQFKRARWIQWRGYMTFWKAATVHLCASLGKAPARLLKLII